MLRSNVILIILLSAIATADEGDHPGSAALYAKAVDDGLAQIAWLKPPERTALADDLHAVIASRFDAAGADNAGTIKTKSFIHGLPDELSAMERMGIDHRPAALHAEKLSFLSAQLRLGIRLHLALRPRSPELVARLRRLLADVAQQYEIYLHHRYPRLGKAGAAGLKAIAADSLDRLDRSLDDYFSPIGTTISEEAVDAQAQGRLPPLKDSKSLPSAILGKQLENPDLSDAERMGIENGYGDLVANEAQADCRRMAGQLLGEDEARFAAQLVGLTIEDLTRLNDARNQALSLLSHPANGK